MKKLISILLVLSVCFSFAGCDLYEGKKKVVGMSYANEIFNGVQNQDCIDGLKLMVSDLKISYFENTDASEFEENFLTIIGEEHDFIWCFEKEGLDSMLKHIGNYPEQNFGIIDAEPENIPSNLTTVTFREYEGGFLAGYAAGRKSQTRKIGFLGGSENNVTKKYEVGYKAGAAYAASVMQQPIEFEVLYTGDDYSRSLGKSSAMTLYNEKGCDIVFQCMQTAGFGAIEAAVELDKLVIGNGSDQSGYGPKNVLTSVIKNAKTTINTVTTKFVEKEEVGGMNFEYGLKDRMIGIAKTNTVMGKDLYSDTMRIRDQIIDGTITVPKNEEELNQYISGLNPVTE